MRRARGKRVAGAAMENGQQPKRRGGLKAEEVEEAAENIIVGVQMVNGESRPMIRADHDYFGVTVLSGEDSKFSREELMEMRRQRAMARQPADYLVQQAQMPGTMKPKKEVVDSADAAKPEPSIRQMQRSQDHGEKPTTRERSTRSSQTEETGTLMIWKKQKNRMKAKAMLKHLLRSGIELAGERRRIYAERYGVSVEQLDELWREVKEKGVVTLGGQNVKLEMEGEQVDPPVEALPAQAVNNWENQAEKAILDLVEEADQGKEGEGVEEEEAEPKVQPSQTNHQEADHQDPIPEGPSTSTAPSSRIDWSIVMKAQRPLARSLKCPNGEEVILEEAYFRKAICSPASIAEIQKKIKMEETEIRDWFKMRRSLDKNHSEGDVPESEVIVEKAWIYYGDLLDDELLEEVAKKAELSLAEAKAVLRRLKKKMPVIFIQSDYLRLDHALETIEWICLGLPKEMLFEKKAEEILEREYILHDDFNEIDLDRLEKETKLTEVQIKDWFHDRDFERQSDKQTTQEKLKKAAIFWAYEIPETCWKEVAKWTGVSVKTAQKLMEDIKKEAMDNGYRLWEVTHGAPDAQKASVAGNRFDGPEDEPTTTAEGLQEPSPVEDPTAGQDPAVLVPEEPSQFIPPPYRAPSPILAPILVLPPFQPRLITAPKLFSSPHPNYSLQPVPVIEVRTKPSPATESIAAPAPPVVVEPPEPQVCQNDPPSDAIQELQSPVEPEPRKRGRPRKVVQTPKTPRGRPKKVNPVPVVVAEAPEEVVPDAPEAAVIETPKSSEELAGDYRTWTIEDVCRWIQETIDDGNRTSSDTFRLGAHVVASFRRRRADGVKLEEFAKSEMSWAMREYRLDKGTFMFLRGRVIQMITSSSCEGK